MNEVDISSILTTAIGLNFGYALLLALADYEIAKRVRRSQELRDIGSDLYTNDPAKLAECQSSYRITVVAIRGALPSIRSWSSAAVALCGVAGGAALLLMFLFTFTAMCLGEQAKLLICIALIGCPFGCALSLWRLARVRLANADKRLRDFAELVQFK